MNPVRKIDFITVQLNTASARMTGMRTLKKSIDFSNGMKRFAWLLLITLWFAPAVCAGAETAKI
ncbi:MAG: hypothetical protein WCJ71_11385, partial [Candidatus Omnitrophota bacterium]